MGKAFKKYLGNGAPMACAGEQSRLMHDVPAGTVTPVPSGHPTQEQGLWIPGVIGRVTVPSGIGDCPNPAGQK